jgi:oligoendopeptidase F
MNENKVPSEEFTRESISEKFKWKLEDLYPSKNEWQASKSEIEGRIKDFAKLKGSIQKSGKDLLKILAENSFLEKELMRLYAFAVMLTDQDTRESGPLGMKQTMMHLETKLKDAASFIEPEILSLAKKRIDFYFETNPELEIYRQAIDDIYRRKEHTLPGSEEKLLAQASLMSGTAHEIYNIFSNADLPYPVVDLSDKKEIRLDATNYSLYRASQNREDRKVVFESFYGTLQKFKRTFGTQLNGEINKNLFYKNVRKYDSCLESSLDRNNIPVDVYHKLIENVNKKLDTLHRYFELRKRMLGLDELHFYDIYASLVKEVDLKYTYEESIAVITKSLQILGDEYGQALNHSFSERWIDVYPNTGKRSGAYMDGIAYDVHPYILMNFKGKYNDVSTLTHELGHAMHSYFSNREQPYVYSQYPIFLAEVASTVNEALLIDHVLKEINNPQQRLSLLGDALEGFRGTLFRQTQFSEFELMINSKAESGEALTGDTLTQMYLDIFKKYYGYEQDITTIDDLYGVEWAYIPHFYYNFYVFQYSTSFTAAQAIADKILQGESGIVDKYIRFLSSGCSEYAIPTLRKVGVDMTGNEPFDLTIKRMNIIMDEIEEIIG